MGDFIEDTLEDDDLPDMEMEVYALYELYFRNKLRIFTNKDDFIVKCIHGEIIEYCNSVGKLSFRLNFENDE